MSEKKTWKNDLIIVFLLTYAFILLMSSGASEAKTLLALVDVNDFAISFAAYLTAGVYLQLPKVKSYTPSYVRYFLFIFLFVMMIAQMVALDVK